MKNGKQFLRVILLCIAGCTSLVSCQSKKDHLVKEITEAENKSYQSTQVMHPDIAKTDALIKLYKNFANSFPDDTSSPQYLYKAADLYILTNRPKDAISCYAEIIQKFERYPKLPLCYFMTAFTYDNNLQDYPNAGKWYQEFIDKFPDHALRRDAVLSLKNLGKTPDEIVKEFEQQMANADSSDYGKSYDFK